MIKIFDANDRNFATAGNIVVLPLKCKEVKKKSLNGWYIEVEIPIKYKDYIAKDKLCVLKTKSKLNPQAFRIGENIKKTNRKITFTANHVMFDAKDYFLVDVRPTNLNGLNALNYINERTDNISPFKIYSNVENVNTAYFIRKNLLEAWATIEERWNGAFDADNWNISFLQNVGHDNGESIIYGKNMQSMEIYEDWSNVVTRLYPVGYNELMLPEKYIESDVQYEKPYTKTVDFQTNLEQEEQTEENLVTELRTNATNYLEENKYPKVSYTTKSDINNNMEIGDIIQVLHPLVSIKTEVLEYEYNSITKKITSLTFGNFTRDVKAKFDNIKNTINQISQNVSKQETVIKQQTDLINSLNKNGYVYIDDNEILILDKIPKETAENVWRFGLGGIGFSSNGYEGPFEIAITMDGQINAKFITTGTMSVSRIEGLANKITQYDQSISEINLQLGNIQAKVNTIQDLTKNLNGTKTIVLEDCIAGDLLELHIYGNNAVFDYLYPSDTLFPSDTLYPYGDSRIVVTDGNNNSITYELGVMEVLRQNGDICDEYVLKDGQAEVIRRINKDGTIKTTEEVEELGDFSIKLSNGTNTITIKNYSAEINIKYATKSDYTDIFATKVEMNSSIELNNEQINIKLSKKTDNDKIIAAINMSTEKEEDGSQMQLQADRINLNGVVTANGRFKILDDGSMESVNGKFSGRIQNGGYPATSKDGGIIISEGGTVQCTNIEVYASENMGGLIIIPNEFDEYFSNIQASFRNSQIAFRNQENNEHPISIGIYANTKTGYLDLPKGVINVDDGTIQTKNINATGYGYFEDYVRASQFVQPSSKSLKENIYKLKSNSKNKKIINSAINILKNADICEYNYKGKNKTSIGLVIGEEYNTPEEVLNEDKNGIDIYSMISLSWKAIQELLEIINKQNKEIEKIKRKS